MSVPVQGGDCQPTGSGRQACRLGCLRHLAGEDEAFELVRVLGSRELQVCRQSFVVAVAGQDAAGGADIGVHKNLTLIVDLIGQKVVDAPRLVRQTFTAADWSTFDQVGFERGSYYINDLAVGMKVSAGGSLLLDVNVLFRLDDAGLRTDISPLVGFEYSF